jgi:heat shock protein HslJ
MSRHFLGVRYEHVNSVTDRGNIMRTDRYRRPFAHGPLTAGFSRRFLLALILVPVFASACIVVVEEDRDRHRYLHGSEWRLEVVFYRTQTIEAADRDATFQFAENGAFTAQTACGGIQGFYTSQDDGAFTVTSLEAEAGCAADASTQVVMDGLRSARTFEADAKALRIRTADNGYLSFAAE